MTKNKLMMNPDKTEFFIAPSHYHYERFKHLSLCLDDVEIFPSPTVRNLGTVFGHSMKMDDHVINSPALLIFISATLTELDGFLILSLVTMLFVLRSCQSLIIVAAF